MTSRRSVLKGAALVTLAAAAGIAGTAQVKAVRASRAYPPTGKFVEVEGLRIHYEQAGTGPDLVLIHGAGGNLRDFTFSFMALLTDRYRVTVFDRPGLGHSEVTRATPSPRDQARILRAAAGVLGVSRPIVLGQSFGGAVAYAWAINDLDDPHPASAAALVSLAGVTLPWPGELGPYYTVNGAAWGHVTIPVLSAVVPESLVKTRVADTFRPQPMPEGYDDYIGGALTMRPGTFRANVRQVNTLRPHVVEMEKRYPELTLPVEILHGTADDIVPIDVHARPFTQRFEAIANLEELPGVGHMPHHVAQEACLEAIERAATRAGLR